MDQQGVAIQGVRLSGVRTVSWESWAVMRKLVVSPRTAPNLKSLLRRMRGAVFGCFGARAAGNELSSVRLPAREVDDAVHCWHTLIWCITSTDSMMNQYGIHPTASNAHKLKHETADNPQHSLSLSHGVMACAGLCCLP